MRSTVTNPDPRIVISNGRKVDITGAAEVKLNNGKVNVVLGIGEQGEYDLTGDQIGYLESLGLQIACPERDDSKPPAGSKKWRAAVAAAGKDPEEELAKLNAAKAKPAKAPTPPAQKPADAPKVPGA